MSQDLPNELRRQAREIFELAIVSSDLEERKSLVQMAWDLYRAAWSANGSKQTPEIPQQTPPT